MKIVRNILMLLGIVFFLSQCSPFEPSDEEGHSHQEKAHEEGHEEEGHNENMVELSDVQVASAELKYGTFDTLNISGFVKANGSLDLPPQKIAAVSAPMAGFVKQANFLVGDYVKKGTTLAVLEHQDYIKLQEEYLNVLSNLNYLKAEWQRQRRLDSAEVTAKKQFQQAEANYKSALARKQALEKQLAYLGFSPSKVAGGNISTVIAIRAPFSGYITQLNVHSGVFVNSEQELYELVDNDHMHLELNVFEQDIYKVKIGQPIRFTVPSIGTDSYQGEVYLVGKSFDKESKTVRVHGHIRGEHPSFIRGLYIEANIYTGDQQVQALPEDAIVVDERKSYIFVRTEEAHENVEEVSPQTSMAEQITSDQHNHQDEAENAHDQEGEAEDGHHESQETHDHGISFRRVQVVTGKKDQGFVEIKQIPGLPADAEIVTKGAYFLFSEMKKGEGGHHHH